MGVFNTAGNFLFGTAGNAVSDATKRQRGINQNYQNQVFGALEPYNALTDVGQTQQLQQDYVSGLTGLNPSEYKVNAPTYDTSSATDAEIQAAIDPNVKYQQEAAIDALESTAAGKGGLFSSGLGKDVATTTEELNAKAYNKAKQDVIAEKNRQNQIASNQFNANTTAGTYNLGLDQTGVNATGQAYNTMMQPLETKTQTLFDLANTQYGANTGLSQQQLQSQAANRGYFGDLLGGAIKIFGKK